MRVSKICTPERIEFERQREYLRDRRWARRRSMIGVGGRWMFLMALALRIDLGSVGHTLGRLVAYI